VGGYAPRARKDSMRPRRSGGASGRPLNFTVRRQFVSLRIGGIAVLLLGVAVAAAGIVGMVRGPSMPSAGDSSTWLYHWRLWGIGIGCGGGAIAIAGVALALGRPWGFLLLALVMIFAATGPWIIEGLGLDRYPYERAGSMETFAFLALSLPALWGYFRHSGSGPDA
jgi:hypothetical protein